MRIAVISDIHGNKYALNSVLEDIKNKNVDTILSAGDLVGYLPYPNEVIELMRGNNIPSIQGNHDEFFASCEPVTEDELKHVSSKDLQANASRLFTNSVLTKENRAYIKRLPKHIKLEFEGLTLMLVHGSPRRNNEYMHEESEHLIDILEDCNEDIIICGHTHIPFHKRVNDKHIINAGSVGKPKHGSSHASYIIIDIDIDQVNVEVVEVSYDLEQLIKDIEGNEMISNNLIENLKYGK